MPPPCTDSPESGGAWRRPSPLTRTRSLSSTRSGRACRRRESRPALRPPAGGCRGDRKSTRLNSSHANISYAVFCLKKKNTTTVPKDRVIQCVQAAGGVVLDVVPFGQQNWI